MFLNVSKKTTRIPVRLYAGRAMDEEGIGGGLRTRNTETAVSHCNVPFFLQMHVGVRSENARSQTIRRPQRLWGRLCHLIHLCFCSFIPAS